LTASIAPVISTPLPGRVKLQAALTGGGNFWRAWCTSAPVGSHFRLELDSNLVSVPAAAEGVASDVPEVDLDVGGAYTFSVQEYTKGATDYGGGYAESPDGYQSETKVGVPVDSVIYVGQRMVTTVGAPQYGQAQAVVWVFNTRIEPTSLKVHGVATPAFVNPSNGRAAVACQNPTALATLATLGGVPAATVIGALDALCTEMRTDIPLHFNNKPATLYHTDALGADLSDTDHDTDIEQLPAVPATPAGFVAFFNTVRANLAQHMASKPRQYHQPAAGFAPDYVNALLAPLPSGADMAQVLVAAGDIYDMYNRHIKDATVHRNVDVTNQLTTALGQLTQTHRDFVAAMRPLAPTVPAALNPAAVQLVHGAGFQESYT
jgi:hypothetical protein